MSRRVRLLPLVAWIGALACEGGDGGPTAPRVAETCGPFSDWQASSYVLPYPPGTERFVDQANCSGYGHSGFWKQGYDFLMPIGSVVTASRAGIVVEVVGDVEDGNRRRTNLVTVLHDDGTVMLYSHLTRGAVVEPGQVVGTGETVGSSGDTGNTGGVPHLHLSLHPCSEIDQDRGTCASIPFNFRNTDPNPLGLVAKRSYRALPY